MKFISTRGNCIAVNASEAIAKGLADDGGLFVPEFFPNVTDKLSDMLDMDYAERASFIISRFLDEYDEKELSSACQKAYGKFEENDPAPVVRIDEGLYIMELFHGPTLAFKDVALTLLPHLLRKGADRTEIKEKILVLVATSGDTGKAALEGFKDQDGIKIIVFYPSDGVSNMQKLQMCTQEGTNVKVVGVKGNFDDCQTAVKKIFSSKDAEIELKNAGYVLSSANSINFGRLVPQVVYYFSSYLDLVNSEEIKLGDKINFVVPTGNFGDILAGYYAKKMGLPINKLICASNSNNVLTEFFASGKYDSKREFYKTTSPSMDILVSSNLERLIYEITSRNAEITKNRMESLKKDGEYVISNEEVELLEKEFYADFSDEEECSQTIESIFEEYGYVVDPHTAVALNVQSKYSNFTEDEHKTVVLSTASPYKFPQSVYKAITGKNITDAFDASKKLYNLTGEPIPEQILNLKSKEVRYTGVAEKEKLFLEVLDFIKN